MAPKAAERGLEAKRRMPLLARNAVRASDISLPLGKPLSGMREAGRRIHREIRRRTRVVGNFPDGRSALILVTARLRYIAGKNWGTRRYMDMSRLGGLVSYQVLSA